MKACRIVGLAAVAALGLEAQAHAGAADATNRTGIKIGPRGRLHLDLSASTGVDTNPNILPYDLILARQPGGETGRLASVGPEITVPQYFPHPNKILFRAPPDVFLAVRPSLALTMPSDRVDVRGNLALNYYEYLGLLQPGLPFIPGTDAYTRELRPWEYNTGYRRLRTLDGRVGGALGLNRKGLFGLTLDGAAIRSVDPGPIVVGTRLARTNFLGNVAGIVRPGGGTMEFSGRMGMRAEIYDPQNGNDFFGRPLPKFTQFDRFPENLLGEGNPVDVAGLAPSANATVDPSLYHNAGLNVAGRWQWRFLPKSAVFVEGGVNSHIYLKFWDNPNAAQFPIFALGGFIGQITSKLGLVATVGVNYPLVLCIDPGANFALDRFNANARCSANTGVFNGQTGASDLDMLLPFLGGIRQYTWWAPEMLRWQPIASAPVGQLEARFQVTPTMVVAAGVRRQTRTVPLYRYVNDNRIYANVTALVAQRVQLTGSIINSFQPHGQLTDPNVAYNAYPFDETVRTSIPFLRDSDPGRFDNDIRIMGGVDVYVTRWFILGATNTFNWHYTNARTGPDGAIPGAYNEPPYNLSYLRNLTVFKVELRY